MKNRLPFWRLWAIGSIFVFIGDCAWSYDLLPPEMMQGLGIKVIWTGETPITAEEWQADESVVPAGEEPPPPPDSSLFQWFGLSCTADACDLQPFVINRNGEETTGATQVPLANGRTLVAVLRGRPLVSARPVTTWYTARTPRLSDDESAGSLGVNLLAKGQVVARFLPRYDAANKNLNFYLEAVGQRQHIDVGIVDLEALTRGISLDQLLVWAGDLDGDGKLDLITREQLTTGQGIRLWLSGKAQSGELVGEAARLQNWDVIEDESE